MRNKKFDSNEIKYNYLTLRVNNISDDTKEQDLADLFSVFGNIKRVFIVTDKMTKRSKGFGFVSYFNKEDAKRGLENLNGIAYDNLILQVEYSIDRDN
jgi:translation initiation factor 3 subunit G